VRIRRGPPIARLRGAKPVAVVAIGTLIVIGTTRSSDAPTTSRSSMLLGYGTSALQTQLAAPAKHQAAAASSPQAASSAGGETFIITGKVSGLYPGSTFPLVLTVTNPYSFAITVTSITTTVSNASSTCLAANVNVSSFSGHLLVGAGKTAKTAVTAKMLHSAPNPCQGVVFPLRYSGLALVP